MGKTEIDMNIGTNIGNKQRIRSYTWVDWS